MKFLKIIVLLSFVIGTSCTTQQKTIYMIGDSTMANKKSPDVNPEFGWGQVLPDFFNERVAIDNRAVNGRSTKSFINENKWDSIVRTLKKGDYVFIQFGHNDQKVLSPDRYTNPHTSYRHNLIRFIQETRKKGARPVLFTSIIRRNFNDQGTLIDTHGEYPMEARLVAQEYKVPFIDLQYLSEQLEEKYGVEGSKKLHLHFEPGENVYYKDGKHDDTHLSHKGASEIAKLAVKHILIHVPSLKKYILNKD